jgi:hypothetical protein
VNKKIIIYLIAAALMFFVLIKVVVAQLCAPTPNNIVVNAVYDAISTPITTSAPRQVDPLSWEPFLNKMLTFFSKACKG